MKKLFLFIDKLFWITSALITSTGAFGMLVKGGVALYEDFDNLKSVLITEVFYSVICFELFQMARIRIEGESNRMVLDHFIFMVTLTFGREIFLIHNMSLWIVVGFSLMVLTYVLFYMWREQLESSEEKQA